MTWKRSPSFDARLIQKRTLCLIVIDFNSVQESERNTRTSILFSRVEFGCKLSQPIETNSLSFLGSKKLRFVLSGQKLMKV